MEATVPVKAIVQPVLLSFRHIALNLIKNEKTSNIGIKTKRAKASWNNQYLLKILGVI